MLRLLRGIVALALISTLSVGVAGAEQRRQVPYGVANDARRQQLLHRSWPSDGVPGSMLITARDDASAADIAAREGGSVVGARTVLLHVEPGTEATVAGRVAAIPDVMSVEPDRVRQPAAAPDDDLYGLQWSHQLTGAEQAWNQSTGSSGVTVAVLDTGVDGSHEDLQQNLVAQVDLSSGHLVERTLGTDNDRCDVGHGTLVAGVIGATANNSEGVAGVAWDVSIVDVALTSEASRCGILDSAIVAGIRYAAHDADADVINMSLGGIADGCPAAIQAAVDDAREIDGTTVVAAAGNEGLIASGLASIPASCNGVVSVGAIGDTGDVAVYSNQNEWVDVAAPGGDTSAGGAGIVSTAAGGGYLEVEGTSFASPYVVGAMALLLSVDPDLSPDDLESLVESTADDRGAPGRDEAYGWGALDLADAVLAAKAGNVQPPVDDPDFPLDTGSLLIERIAPANGSTGPVAQAVEMSKQVYDDGAAFHAVIARSDDYADALAGSSLGFGVGPLLFTPPTGPLNPMTSAELSRVLPGGSTVYLLGGTAALPPSLESEISALGFRPVRVAGTSRQLTSVAVARELEQFLIDNEFDVPRTAIVATAYNWPDAVVAGSFGAWFGMPILVTQSGSLDPAVAQFLGDRTWQSTYVIGGTAAISEATRSAVVNATGLTSSDVVRLAGVDRNSTAVSVAREYERIFAEQLQAAFGEPGVPRVVAAVNMRRANGFAHVLSATSLLGAVSGVFLPVDGADGSTITQEAQMYACRFPAAGVVVGTSAIITDATLKLVDALLKGDAPVCTG